MDEVTTRNGVVTSSRYGSAKSDTPTPATNYPKATFIKQHAKMLIPLEPINHELWQGIKDHSTVI